MVMRLPKRETYDIKRDESGVIWFLTSESRTQESLHKVLETLKEEF